MRWLLPILGCLGLGQIRAEDSPVVEPLRPSLWPQGRYVYQRNCQVCHGVRGDGNGEMASSLGIKPRDFRRGLFKFRSTPSGSLPRTSDLHRTIRHGVAHTSMPMFTQLTDREIEAVVEFVRSFSPAWRVRENYALPLAMPKPPDPLEDPARHAHGRALFLTACAVCHGEDGAGHGPSAVSLTDAWGHAVPPADLRQPTLKTGMAPDDIYRALVTGRDGTPMPSFLESTTEAERWALVAYVLSLRETMPPEGR